MIYIDPKGYEYPFGVECRTVEAVRDLTERGHDFNVRVPVKDPEWVSLLIEHALAVGDCMIGIDEYQRFTDTYHMIPGIQALLEDGGARGVSLVAVTHRPTDIKIDNLAAADRLIVFQTTHSSDIQRLQHYIDAPDEEFIDLSAPSEEDPMRVSEYLEWHVTWGRRYEKKTFGGEVRKNLRDHTSEEQGDRGEERSENDRNEESGEAD